MGMEWEGVRNTYCRGGGVRPPPQIGSMEGGVPGSGYQGEGFPQDPQHCIPCRGGPISPPRT